MLAQQKNVELDIDSIDDSIYIEAPSCLLREVISNLPDNSIQHMRQPGTVTISLLQLPNSVLLCLCDTGPDIPEAERSKVFERFYRFNSGKPNCSALGLAIIKEICEALRAQ